MGPEFIVILAAMGALLAGVAGSMAAASRRARPHQDAAEAAWREAAEALAGEITVTQRASAPRELALTAELEGARVLLETKVPLDPLAMASTRAHARFALGEGPVFRMGERASSGAGDAAVLAELALAARVHLSTPSPDALAALFTPSVSQAALAFPRRLALSSSGRAVLLEWDGVEYDARVLAQAARLVGGVAIFGAELLRELSTLEGGRLVASDAEVHVEIERGAATITLEAAPTAGRPAYTAATTPLRALPAFDVRVTADGVIEGELPPGVIDPDEAPLASIGAAHLVTEAERITLRWDAPPDRAQADAGVRLLAAIATGGGRRGAFR